MKEDFKNNLVCKYCGKTGLSLKRVSGYSGSWKDFSFVLYESDGFSSHKPLCDWVKGFPIRYAEFLKTDVTDVSCDSLLSWLQGKPEKYQNNYKFRSIKTLIQMRQKDLLKEFQS